MERKGGQHLCHEWSYLMKHADRSNEWDGGWEGGCQKTELLRQYVLLAQGP